MSHAVPVWPSGSPPYGARSAGINASRRLVAVAQDRNPDADIRVGDMNALPWEDASFDVAAWEFPDPETFARALASTGPAYEAI